jgi:Heparinase II/III-like protein
MTAIVVSHIEDRIAGPFRTAQALFHLHPRVEVLQQAAAELRLSAPLSPTPLRMSFEHAGAVEVPVGTWHPRFGVAHPNRCIVVDFSGPALVTRLEWT